MCSGLPLVLSGSLRVHSMPTIETGTFAFFGRYVVYFIFSGYLLFKII